MVRDAEAGTPLGVERVLALWSPDWPVTAAARAAHVPAHRPAAVFHANRVLACTATARSQGVRRGLRRREAQARCPDLAVLAPDTGRDARLFEPVVRAVEELAPGVEVVRPGLLVLPARGPVGWFGGELSAAERLIDQVALRTRTECQVGVADGTFAAVLAARRGRGVPPGRSAEFLAPLEVAELDRDPEVDRSELVDLLRRLGLRSLGAFAALPAADVASRFGADAVVAHRLARGLDPRPPARRIPPEELAAAMELDPPVDRVDAAAFAARGLAGLLHEALAGHGLACTRLGVHARTEAGEELLRVWRCAEPLTPGATVDRVRWQLDSWLGRGGSGALVTLRLTPEETVPAGVLQRGLWGDVGEADERAGRALVRAQALLGPEGVLTPVLTGGRDPGERVRLVPWGEQRDPELPAVRGTATAAGTGRIRSGPAEPLTTGARVSSDSSAAGTRIRPGDPAAAGTRVTFAEAAVSEARATSAAPETSGMRLTSAEPGPSGVRAAWVEPGTSGVRAAWVEPGTSGVRAASVEPGTSGVRAASEEPGTSEGPVVPGEPGLPSRRPSGRRPPPDPPPSWPGRLPAPSPAVVPVEPVPVRLLASGGEEVHPTHPDRLDAGPARVSEAGAPERGVLDWAGPWPVHTRWWALGGPGPSVRIQVVLDDGDALLLAHSDGRWWTVGVY